MNGTTGSSTVADERRLLAERIALHTDHAVEVRAYRGAADAEAHGGTTAKA
jgi:hypothetical protein